MNRMFLEEGLVFVRPDVSVNVKGIEEVLSRVTVHWAQGHQIHSAAGSWGYVASTAPPMEAAAMDASASFYMSPTGIVPPSQRLASVFFAKLGRELTSSRPSTADLLLPRMIELPRAFRFVPNGDWSGSDSAGNEFVSLSEKDINERVDRDLSSSEKKAFPRASQLYGHGTFSITIREIVALMSTTRLVTDESLPKSFFASLQFSLVSAPWAKYDFVHAHVPVSLLGTPFPSLDVQLQEESEFFRLCAAPPEGDDSDLENMTEEKFSSSKAVVCVADPDKWRWMASQNHERQLYRRSLEKAELEKRRAKMNETLAKVILQEMEDSGGFNAESKQVSFAKTMGLSLSDWSYRVCLSTKTHFFVQNTEAHSNQLAEKPLEPVAVVFGRRVDFCSFEEMSKLVGRGSSAGRNEDDTHSVSSGTSSSTFSSLRRSADVLVYGRFRNLFTLLFRSVQLQGAKNVVFQPFIDTSSSVFISQLPPDFISGMSSLHFQALYDVLQEEWGVEYCYLCGEDYHSWAITSFASKAYSLKCHIVFHEKDAKHLAIELARKRRKTALLCPADIWTMLFGRVGSYWEDEDVDSTPLSTNAALIDCCATSLVGLSSFGATGEYGLCRICDESDVTGVNKWAEVALPYDFNYFQQFPVSADRKRKPTS